MSAGKSEKPAESEESGEAIGGNGSLADAMRLLPLVNSAVLVLLLVLAMISAIIGYGVSDRMSALEAQTRKMVKATQALEEQLAVIKDMVEMVRRPAANHVLAPAAAPATGAGVRIETPKSSGDCVIRSGDPKSLANCMNR